jgi:serine/threonine-protein kinase
MDKPMLGDYRIEGIVGVGRMGVVYLAIDRITGRAIALKVLRDDIGIDPVYRARFRREGELLAGLQHPHILPIHGTGEVEGELYIATRLVSTTLRNLIVAGTMTTDLAMTVLTRVAAALDAAHSHGVIHRDVKPANVLMDPGPDVYLGDFGLARAGRRARHRNEQGPERPSVVGRGPRGRDAGRARQARAGLPGGMRGVID